MSHTVIWLVWRHLLDKSVFDLGYIITHIFKSTHPNRTRFSALCLKFSWNYNFEFKYFNLKLWLKVCWDTLYAWMCNMATWQHETRVANTNPGTLEINFQQFISYFQVSGDRCMYGMITCNSQGWDTNTFQATVVCRL